MADASDRQAMPACACSAPAQAAAAQVAEQAHPTADAINSQVIDPAAAAVEQNARPLADQAIARTLEPASEALTEDAEPTADRIAKEAIQPAAQVKLWGARQQPPLHLHRPHSMPAPACGTASVS